MSPKDIADLFIEAVGKIEFYWNFYTGTLLVLIGWLLTAKKALTPRLKVFVTIGFVAFAAMNIIGLWGSYAFAEALRSDLINLPEPKLPNTLSVLRKRDFLDQRTLGLMIHLGIDAFAIYAIWRTRIGETSKDGTAQSEQEKGM
jgi:hypothetical protein